MSREHVESYMAITRKHVECYKAITRKLDLAIAEHGLESPEAEALREESDPPWDAMTEGERDECREWSAQEPLPTDENG